MSNFLTITPLTGGDTGTAPTLYSASTNDTLSDVTDPGYMDDLYDNGVVKANDILWLNYDVDGTSTLELFKVTYSGGIGASLSRFINGIKAGSTPAWAGGGTSHAFSAPGVLPDD